LGTESSVVSASGGVTDLPRAGHIEFHEVGFRYPGAERPVLDNLTFSARPGTLTAIVGATGSGKTTLVSLIPRLIDVTAGSITVGGVDIREIDPEALW